jgi:TP901 family phage tail tape measure protein
VAYNEKLRLEVEADNKASDKIDKVTKSVKDLGTESKQMGDESESSWKKISSSIDRVTGKIEDVNRTVRHYNTMMSGLNRGMINLFEEAGAVIFDFTSDAINNFTELSEQHAKTLGAMANNYDRTADSQARFMADAQKLKDQAIYLGTYGVTGAGSLINATGVSQAQTELVKAGLTSDDILNKGATENVLKFAQANQLDTGSAVEFAVALGNQFNIPVDQWGPMLDKVSHTADLSTIGVNDIVQSMKYASGISSGVGKSLDETLGMVAVLGNFGLRGSQAGSSIQALLTRILTGDTTVITDAMTDVAPPKALDAFYNFEKAAKPNGELLPMNDVVDQLDETMAGLNDEEQAWFAKKLFGLYQMKGAYALISGDADALEETINNIEEQSDGTNLNKLNQILESQYGQLTSLGNMWDSIKTDIGDRANPMVNAIRDELFNFLKNNGNYRINFDGLRDALNESADLIEEKYGIGIADAIRNLGSLTIDFAEVVEGVAPEFASGLLGVFSKAIKLDIPGTIGEWNDMISSMKDAVGDLPADLQEMGSAVVDVIDLFGKLAAFNVAMQGLEGATNLTLLVTNISSALSTLVGLLGGIPGLVLTVGAIGTIIGIDKAGKTGSDIMNRESIKRNVYQFDNYNDTETNPKITPGMDAEYDRFIEGKGIKADSDVATLMMYEMQKYVYESGLNGKTVTSDNYRTVLSDMYSKYLGIISGGDGYYTYNGKSLTENGPIDDTSFGQSLYKFDEYGNPISSTVTTLYSEMYDYILNNVPGMDDKSRTKNKSPKLSSFETPIAGFADSGETVRQVKDDTNGKVLIDGSANVTYNDPSISTWDKLSASFSKDAWKYGLPYSDGGILAGISNWDYMLGSAMYDLTGIKGWWYNGESRDGAGNGTYKGYNDQVSDALSQNVLNEIMDGVDWSGAFSDVTIDWGSMIPGYNAMSQSGQQSALQEYFRDNGIIKEQSDIERNMTFSPQMTFNPNINVDVTVDSNGNVTSKNVSILDPLWSMKMSQWFNKTSSQYGQTSK